MTTDLDERPESAIALCRAAHRRLTEGIAGLDETGVRAPSLLPGWTVGHVLTHVARNADGHVRRLEGALVGEDLPRYPGGPSERNRDIELGAGRSAPDLIADVVGSATRLEEVWDECIRSNWPHGDLRGSDDWVVTSSPVRRLREVEFHHVDLGRGYVSDSWDDDYVHWELKRVLAGVPQRLRSTDDARATILWLTRDAPCPGRLDLEPW